MPNQEYNVRMVRIAADADIFTAVAEPSRRAILDLLASGERAVNDVVTSLRLAQPQVSKHLRVLRVAGLVSVRSVGRRRLYRVERVNTNWVDRQLTPCTHGFTVTVESGDIFELAYQEGNPVWRLERVFVQ